MNVGAVGGAANNYAQTKAVHANETAGAEGAAKRAKSQWDENPIGMFTAGNKVYPVTFAESSTAEDPVVKVGKTEIHIKNVNPKNATAAEMCALLSYQDKMGISGNHGMSSFSKLKAYGMQAEANGVCSGLYGADAVWDKKQNWTQIIGSAENTFSKIPAAYGQAVDCKRLLSIMEKWVSNGSFIGKSVDPRKANEAWMNQPNTNFDFGTSYDVSGAKGASGTDGAAGADKVGDTDRTSSAGSSDEIVLNSEGITDLRQYIRDRIDEMFVKFMNGDTEPTFVIGGRSFTAKEWDDLLEKFDSAEEALRKIMAEEAAKKQAEDAKFEAQNASTSAEAAQTVAAANAQIDMLLSETVAWSRFYTGQVDDEGQPIEDTYMVAMDNKSIRCSKPGEAEYEWEIELDDEAQIEQARDFMAWAGGYMDNFLFAAHEEFWRDFLDENIDMAAFKDFLENSTVNGRPVYTYGDSENMYIDREKVQWAKYMNNPKGFTPIEDIEKMLLDHVKDKQKNLTLMPNNPAGGSANNESRDWNFNEQAMFSRYPGSRSYSVSDIAQMIFAQTLGQFPF